MDPNTPQIITALTFLMLGIFIIVDQASIIFNLPLGNAVKIMFLISGIFALFAGITLLLSARQEE